MPFRFKRKESVKKAVRRLWCERLNDALDFVEKGGKFVAVHDVRKEIKKMRAILRLVRAEIGKDVYGEHTTALRGAANRLTALRDAKVKLGAFDDLVKSFKRKLPPQPFPQIKTALRKHCRMEEGHFFKGGSIASVKGVLRHEKQHSHDLKISSDGWKAIKPGLKRIYDRGRRAFETADRDPSPENFHEWRKRVKDLAHQLRILCPGRPRKFRARTGALDKLGNLLGDDHDLVMLRQFVVDQFGHSPNVKLFERLVSSRQNELRSHALKLGARFYPKKPNRFCRRIERDWKKLRRKGLSFK
jgi:CHAD domain-containing protein